MLQSRNKSKCANWQKNVVITPFTRFLAAIRTRPRRPRFCRCAFHRFRTAHQLRTLLHNSPPPTATRFSSGALSPSTRRQPIIVITTHSRSVPRHCRCTKDTNGSRETLNRPFFVASIPLSCNDLQPNPPRGQKLLLKSSANYYTNVSRRGGFAPKPRSSHEMGGLSFAAVASVVVASSFCAKPRRGAG